MDSNGDSKCYLSHSDLIRHSLRTHVMHNSKLVERPHLNTFRKLSCGNSGKQPVQQPVSTFTLRYFRTETQLVSSLVSLVTRVSFQKSV